VNENDLFVDHVEHSVGGFGGHAFRRATHVSMAAIPYLYYVHGEAIASSLTLDTLGPREFVSAFCILLLAVEAIRLRTGIVIVGQREYESNQISALAWGSVGVALAILIAPTEGKDGLQLEGMEAGLYGAPLIMGMTFVDPVMGEVKRIKKDLKIAIIAGMVVSYSVWLCCYFWLGTDFLAAILLAPLTVAGEIPSNNLIDDNATMVLFPLCGLVLLLPFL
tara:strand:- start:2017 stop:2679 length:663 start_codon:yes stop_codon:yes gene_type:complete